MNYTSTLRSIAAEASVNTTGEQVNNMVKINTKQSGYTVVELLTTIAVVGILSAVAIPGTRDIIQNNRRVNMTNNLVYTMHLARNEAVKRNQQVTACPSRYGWTCDTTDWARGWIIFNDIDQDRQFDSGNEAILLTMKGSDTVDISPETFTTRFTYRPNGRAMGAAVADNTGQFTFCDSRGADEARVVIIRANGRPELSEAQSDGSPPDCS
jgi:type IV fimbrial biogenesis protein FimT